MKNVLIVATDRDGQAMRISRRLTDDSYHPACCGGPHAPSFLCAGAQGDGCALTEMADVVVLDGWLSDVERRGVPSWHLLRYYRGLGLPVVALIGPDGLPAPVRDTGVCALPRDATASEISEAVRSLCEAHAAG